MKVLMIDNYDSFTYNLVQLLKEDESIEVTVVRNDEIDLAEVVNYDRIVISPGPGLPKEAGLLCELIAQYQSSKPILGVCLGMQAIAEVAGAKLVNMAAPMHGVATTIEHTGSVLFNNIPETFEVGRYHSWAVEVNSLPGEFKVTATDEQGLLMAIEHKELPLYAVQFHPESILTQYGKMLIFNFLKADL